MMDVKLSIFDIYHTYITPIESPSIHIPYPIHAQIELPSPLPKALFPPLFAIWLFSPSIDRNIKEVQHHQISLSKFPNIEENVDQHSKVTIQHFLSPWSVNQHSFTKMIIDSHGSSLCSFMYLS